MNRQSYKSQEDSGREAANRAALAEWVWLVRGGVAKAVMLPDGTIKGMRFSDDGDGSLVEVWIKKPTK